MLSERLKTLRKEKGLTQVQLSEMIGISNNLYNKYEKQNVRPPYETISQLAKIFGVSVDYLLGRTDEPNPNNQLTNTQPNLLPELLVQLDSLSLEQQEKVVAFIKGLLA